MKNEPLDWMEIEQKIGEIMAKEKFPYCNVSVKARQEIMYVLLKKLVPFIKQHIKSACEFYSRYKDNPELLIKEHIEFKTAIEKLFNIEGKLRNDGTITRDIPEEFDYPKIPLSKSIYYDYKKYNKWLFKLAFKSVFEEEENEE